MSIQELYREIRLLSEREREELLLKILFEKDMADEIERIGYLRLTDRAFDFWNDPREDMYQDYLPSRQRLNE